MELQLVSDTETLLALRQDAVLLRPLGEVLREWMGELQNQDELRLDDYPPSVDARLVELDDWLVDAGSRLRQQK